MKQAVAQKKALIIERALENPSKLVPKSTFGKMTHQREQAMAVTKVKESMDKVYEKGFNVLDFDFVEKELNKNKPKYSKNLGANKQGVKSKTEKKE